MKEYPTEIERRGSKFKLQKIYENFALYKNEFGTRECFNLCDVGGAYEYQRRD